MAGDPSKDENGSRVTLALVSAQVAGLHELMRAELGSVQRQLDAVTGLPLIVSGIVTSVTRLRTEMDALEGIKGRIERLEDSDSSQLTSAQQRKTYRAQTLPMILLGVAGLVFSGIGVMIAYAALHH